MRRTRCVIAALAGLSACTTGTPGILTPRPDPAPRAAEPALTEHIRDATGHCWATEVTPAVYEQVPGQVQVVPAQVAADGSVINPPVYRNGLVPKLVTPRGEYRFEAPCPGTLTEGFIATLQRALYARGYYRATITGRMDDATGAAVRRYQAERGLDSAQLSLATAQELGLIAVDLE